MMQIYTWGAIVFMTLASTAGDVYLALAMRQVGDMGLVMKERGLFGVIRSAISNLNLMIAIFFMAITFFALLIGLSWADLSLLVPATASLTFVTNAIAAQIFLHERVDGRRWVANVMICLGVALLAR
jgi:drug/metabolite transporter (DMT)-like permease